MKSGTICAVILACSCDSSWADGVGPYVYGSVGRSQANIDESAVDSQVLASEGGTSVTSSVKGNPMASGTSSRPGSVWNSAMAQLAR
jgi:hypothetical protein